MMVSSLSSALSAESSLQIIFFSRSYYAYRDIWNSIKGKELQLKREADMITSEMNALLLSSKILVLLNMFLGSFLHQSSFIFWQGYVMERLLK